jgi:outer membrane protein TolC
VELFAIRRFLQQGDVEDLDLARSLLQTSYPLLGQTPQTTGALAKLSLVWGHVARSQQELSTRKQQLRTLYASRQEQVDLQVAAAFVDVEQKFIEVGLARDTLDSWQTRADLLESNRELVRDGYPELLAARGERLKARSQLLHAIVELELAHVRLDGTLGTLCHCRSNSTLRSSSSNVWLRLKTSRNASLPSV